MEINQSILLNLSGEPQCINLPAKQGDIHTRYLTCSFQMNQTPYVIPASATARVCFHKPDDLCVVQDAEIRDNTVILELTQQMLAVPGTAQCEICLLYTSFTVPARRSV